jgi:hypothetical protein
MLYILKIRLLNENVFACIKIFGVFLILKNHFWITCNLGHANLCFNLNFGTLINNNHNMKFN